MTHDGLPRGHLRNVGRRWLLPAAGICLALAVVACHTTREMAPADRSPKAGGVFRYSMSYLPETLDPRELLFNIDRQVASLIYEGLVGFGQSPGEIRPLLAESWEVGEDGCHWVFTLRPDVYFQDDPCFPDGQGRQVVAADVEYSIGRLAAEETAWNLLAGKIVGFEAFEKGTADRIAGITILSSHRLRFELVKPDNTFLKILATGAAYVVPAEAVQHYGDAFRRHPVGTGPFRMARWRSLQEILLVRNDRYWRRDADHHPLPYLEAIEIRQAANFSQIFSGFLKGENYLLEVNEKFFHTQVLPVLEKEEYEALICPYGRSCRFFGFAMDLDTPFSRRADLRRAVDLAFDRDRLADLLPGIFYHPPATLAPLESSEPSGARSVVFDPRQAGEIFRRHARELAVFRPLRIASNLEYPSLEVLRQCLAPFGLRLEFSLREVEYYPSLIRDRTDLLRVSFVPSLPDPTQYYLLFYSGSPPHINLTAYANPRFDRILEESLRETDPSRRRELFGQLEDILRQDCPAIQISHANAKYFVMPSFVRGLKLSFVYPDLTEVWLEQEDGYQTRH